MKANLLLHPSRVQAFARRFERAAAATGLFYPPVLAHKGHTGVHMKALTGWSVSGRAGGGTDEPHGAD